MNIDQLEKITQIEENDSLGVLCAKTMFMSIHLAAAYNDYSNSWRGVGGLDRGVLMSVRTSTFLVNEIINQNFGNPNFVKDYSKCKTFLTLQYEEKDNAY